jgi:uncharacterized protein (TIGR00299 family) protein
MGSEPQVRSPECYRDENLAMKVWFNCSAGVAGDMLMSSLIDAGADQLQVMDAWGALGVDGFSATWERVQRCGVSALWTNLVLHEHAQKGSHRPASQVIELIERSDLADRIRVNAAAVYRTLAEVEGEIHGIDPADVELHEVGALDSVLDVVGVCAALDALDIDEINYSPIAVGHGTVSTEHGQLPNPVPAVTRLLVRSGAKAVGLDTTMELSTPTGVAILTVLGVRSGPLPSMTTVATGFGAGTADPPGRPNVVQAIIGSSVSPNEPGGMAHLVEANVDDTTGEVLAHSIAQLIRAGAHDAWVTPIVMKKGRPAHTISALCDDASLDRIRAVIVDETGTLGLRASTVRRWPQHRRDATVEIDGHQIRLKISDTRIKVEHDDAAAVAAALGRPLRDVLNDAERLGGALSVERG